MDLNQLKTFVTVAKTSSLTRAASLLYLSQPAVSAHIKALESEFNVRLFIRNPRGMELTPTGIIMRDAACAALAAASKFEQKARSINEVSTCNLGTISVPIILNLPGVLSELRRRHQNVNLNISQNISGHIIDAVVSGEIDAGFVIGDIHDKNLEVMVISPITLCIVGPWAWRDKIQAAEWVDIQTFPWLATPEKCSFSTITREFFERNNAILSPSMVADQEKMLTELVCLEMGLTLMREDIALPAQDREQVYIWPKAKTVSQLCFVWAKGREPSPVINALIESVKTLWILS